jgi:transcriptional regulator with XRE-family HTH domain
MAHLIRDCKMSPEELAERARVIRLEDKAVAAAAGIAENTVSRTFGGKTQPLLITCRAIEAAILAEELRLRDYLFALHGAPQAPSAQQRNSPEPEPIPAAADGEAVS